MQNNLAGVCVGPSQPVRVMGVINVSPESFYKDSIYKDEASIGLAARKMEVEGADFIDVGAMSTAPYLNTRITEEEEAYRLKIAIRSIKKMCRVPVCADTSRYAPARAALDAGADVLNDISGLRADPKILALAKKFRGVIVMANPAGLRQRSGNPISSVKNLLSNSVKIALKSGVSESRVAIDPGIGFFRDQPMKWWQWDLAVLKHLGNLCDLKKPILVGVSRKSFIGEFLKIKKPEDRLAGSLAATAAAVLNGAAIIRTHDVRATREAVRLTEALRS